jgi:hypothetical protein
VCIGGLSLITEEAMNALVPEKDLLFRNRPIAEDENLPRNDGRRFLARGSIRSGRFPTSSLAIPSRTIPQSQSRFFAELSLNFSANPKSDCNAPLKLNRHGTWSCSLAARTISARTRLYAASVMPISLRTISGVLHRRTSMPKAILIERRLSSACHL